MNAPKKWQDCETGLIDKMLVDQEKVKGQVTRRRVLSTIAVGSVGCVGAFLFTTSKRSKPADTQMACEQVHEHLQDFVDDEITDLYLSGLVSRHLFVCEACQKAYQGMIDGNDFLCEGRPASA